MVHAEKGQDHQRGESLSVEAGRADEHPMRSKETASSQGTMRTECGKHFTDVEMAIITVGKEKGEVALTECPAMCRALCVCYLPSTHSPEGDRSGSDPWWKLRLRRDKKFGLEELDSRPRLH